MPDISVIIPLYNKGMIIERTVKSVLEQTYPNFELIIVDDGSTDNSVEVVQQIKDERIRLIRQKNSGPSAARNTGVRNANTDWVVFLDGDDELLPDALKHFSFLRNNNNEIDIFNCSYIINRKGNKKAYINPIEGKINNNLKNCFYGNISPGSGRAMFRKSLCDKYQYNEHIRRFEDAELLLRMLPNALVYSSKKPSFIINADFSNASAKRKEISEDYAGHLSLKGKSFWAKMCVYKTFLENRDLYKDDMHRLYPSWYWRYDLLLLYKILKHFK
jgi:glycosyltransferase involved in cell wall biosynthesis